MPDQGQPTPPTSPTPAAPPPSGARPQPPFGTSPATAPTPNRGFEMAGQQRLALIVDQLTQMLPMVGASSEIGQSVLDAIKKLSKHVQPGSVSPASKNNQLMEMMRKNLQGGGVMQALQRQGGAPGAGGAPAGGAAMPKPAAPPTMAA